MRNFFFSVLLISLVFLPACSIDNGITPYDGKTDQIQQNISVINGDYISEKHGTFEEYGERVENVELIPLPSQNTLLTAITNFFPKVINGLSGGTIDFELYLDLFSGLKIKGRLEVPKNAYTGTKEISIGIENNTASFSFSPSPMIFNVPLKFDVEIRGLDVSGLKAEEVVFVYIGEDGNFYYCENDKIEINQKEKKLKVVAAKLKHFSRYGFTKRQKDID